MIDSFSYIQNKVVEMAYEIVSITPTVIFNQSTYTMSKLLSQKYLPDLLSIRHIWL